MPENQSITPANPSNYNPKLYSQELTNFAQGWKQSEANELEQMLNFIAPQVFISGNNKHFEYKFSEPNFCITDLDDMRASGSSFKHVRFAGDSLYAKVQNKGLTMRLDRDDVSDFNSQERCVQDLMKRLFRSEIHRAVKLLYSVANRVDLENETEEIQCTWDSNANPDSDIRENLIIKAAKVTGTYPNRILFGDTSWFSRSKSYEKQDNPGGFNASSLTPERLAQKLLVDKISILKTRHKADEYQDSEAMLGNKILAFYALDGALKDEPTNIKRFVSPLEDNMNFRVYVEEKAKYIDITVEHYSLIAVTALGITSISINES